MERSLYFENYLNNIQSEVFLLAYDQGFSIIDFITIYMKSSLRKELDSVYTSWFLQPAVRIFEEIAYNNTVPRVEEQKVNRDAVEWLGYFYSKWHFLTGEKSKTILRFLPAEEGIKQYYVLHQLDESEAIQMCKRRYNLNKNNHRKYETIKNEEYKQYYVDPIYYSFLSVRLLYKLSKNPLFKDMKYTHNKDDYDFIFHTYSVGVKANVIEPESSLSVEDCYQNMDKEASLYPSRADLSIAFVFLFSSIYENNEEKLLMDIDQIRERFKPYERQYSVIYIYMSGKIYEISNTNEVSIYCLPLSKREKHGIIRKMREVGLSRNSN